MALPPLPLSYGHSFRTMGRGLMLSSVNASVCRSTYAMRCLQEKQSGK